MKRAGCLPILAVAAVLAAAAPVAAASWRPPVTSRYAALAADLVPVHVALVDAIDLVATDIATLNGHVSALRTDDIAASAAVVDADLDAITAAAIAGLAVLDAYPAELCSLDYVASERVAFLLAGDAVDATRAGLTGDIGPRISAARYLLTSYGDLLESVVTC